MSFGQELCEAWGLDADKVTQIEVVIEPSRVPPPATAVRHPPTQPTQESIE